MQRSSIPAGMPKGQRWLKDHLSAQGYKVDKGICFGISNIVVQAILAKDLETFDARLRLLHSIPPDQLNERIKAVNDKIIAIRKSGLLTPVDEFLSEEEQLLISIPPFMDCISLYQNPNDYPQLFETKPGRQDFKAVAPLVRSQHLSEVGKIAFFTGAYDVASLEKYLDGLVRSLNNCDVPAAFILQSESHAITISYDNLKKRWSFTDSNQLPTKFKNTQQMASSIIGAFSKNNQAVFSTSIFSEVDNKKKIENALSDWMAREKNNITKDNVMFADSRQRTWLSMAVNTNNLLLVQTLLAMGASPTLATTSLNEKENELTPLHHAVNKKNEEMVRCMVIMMLKSINVNPAQLNTMTQTHTENLMKLNKAAITAYINTWIPSKDAFIKEIEEAMDMGDRGDGNRRTIEQLIKMINDPINSNKYIGDIYQEWKKLYITDDSKSTAFFSPKEIEQPLFLNKFAQMKPSQLRKESDPKLTQSVKKIS